MGARPSAVATLVERTSRFTAIVALPDGIKAERVTPHLTRSLLGIPPQLRRTLTWNRGREMAGHQAVTAETGMPIYLCKPRGPWQRGTNENTNRLLPQYLPRAWTSARSARPTWTPSPTNSTIVRVRPMAIALRQRSTLAS
ncbi:IS30 family transposase [Streptomyces sp. Inha503]|uniref:IS30 family transposase n=1 Tax=Streptomyces sp. Inha503 TaxID=3383314 RepID=UPI0039A016C2